MSVARLKLTGFVRAEPAQDGAGVKLVLIDEDGRTVVLSLEGGCLGELMFGLPRPRPASGEATPVRAWRLDAAEPGATTLTLTLHTTDGGVAAFRLTPGQLAGIATVSAQSDRPTPEPRRLN
jgi:hypothetical protein